MSSVGAVNNSSYYTPASSSSKKSAETDNTKKSTESTKKNEGFVYEKSSSTKSSNYVKDNTAIVNKLKADAEARISQMRDLVSQMMSQQGSTIGKADSMWRFLANGNFTVSADVKAQAQKDIADDGYWGVEQTSNRIVDFAKALSGGDSEKADKMIEAFKKGFEQATKSWGKTLPDISQRTYDAVLKKLDSWKNGTESVSSSDTE